MEDWTMCLRELVHDGSPCGISEETARDALMKVLDQAKAIQITRWQAGSVPKWERDGSLGQSIYHLYLVNQSLKRKNYRLACHELTDVLYFTKPQSVGMQANIVSVLEAGLGVVDKK